jgi:hypothetical protein
MTVYILEGRSTTGLGAPLYRAVAKVLWEYHGSRFVFIIPTVVEDVEESGDSPLSPEIGRSKPFPCDLNEINEIMEQLVREVVKVARREDSASEKQARFSVAQQAEFYIFPILAPVKEEAKEYFEFLRLFHPLITTSIAVSDDEKDKRGYIYLETCPDLYHWTWLGCEDISRILKLINFLKEKHLIRRVNIPGLNIRVTLKPELVEFLRERGIKIT